MNAAELNLLVGIGNEFRTDDGLGIFISRELKRRRIPEIRILEHSGEGSSLMELWRGTKALLIVDALCSGEAPGVIKRIDIVKSPVPRHTRAYSCHAFGVSEALATAQRLQQLPPCVILYGIVGALFDFGVGLSDPVLRSVPELLSLIHDDIRFLLQE